MILFVTNFRVNEPVRRPEVPSGEPEQRHAFLRLRHARQMHRACAMHRWLLFWRFLHCHAELLIIM
jgi:hypothetical protein